MDIVYEIFCGLIICVGVIIVLFLIIDLSCDMGIFSDELLDQFSWICVKGFYLGLRIVFAIAIAYGVLMTIKGI